MIVFDVRCQVVKEVQVKDAAGAMVTLSRGEYRLQGLEHLILLATGRMEETGVDITLVDSDSGRPVCTLDPGTLGELISRDDLEVEI